MPTPTEHLRRPARPTLLLLLVEDNPADAEYVQELLDLVPDGKVEVRHAETLAAARSQLSDAPDCALLDLNLPDTDGLEGVADLSRHAPELPIVVLTGQRDREVGMQAVKNGAQDFLTKGDLDAESMLRTIHYAIERKAAERALQRRASHDSLTGLPNRDLLVDRLSIAGRRQRPDARLAVLFIDLDGFKDVNDRHGHAAGDRLLKDVASVLMTSLRPGDTVARFGGDEFAVLCEDLLDAVAAVQIAERIVAAISAVSTAEWRVSASVGIACQLGPGLDPDELLAQADEAMYRAKRQGKARVVVHDLAADSEPPTWPAGDDRRRSSGVAHDALELAERLRHAERVIRGTFHAAPEPIAVVERRADGAVFVVCANDALRALTGCSTDELVRDGLPFLEVDAARDGASPLRHLRRADGGEAGVHLLEVVLEAAPGDTRQHAVWHLTQVASPGGLHPHDSYPMNAKASS
jgi:two-component system cell cycle response regulator